MNTNRPSKTFMVFPGMKPAYTTDPTHPGERRSQSCGWLPNRIRHLLTTMIGEYVGTYLFLFFAFAATQVANNSRSPVDRPASTSTILYIALAFGFSLAVNVWIFFRISGGLFNPAVTVALALIGAIGWFKAVVLIIAQVLGAITAAAVVSGLFPGPMTVRTSLSRGTSITRGLFIETLLTAELIFCIFMLAAEKHKATFLAPIGIGLALFIAELAGVFYTGGSLNPARSFGPDVILGHFDGYHWIYWLGPMLGALLAVLFYRLIKFLEYETANPGADSDGHDFHNAELPLEEGRVHDSSRRTDGANDLDFTPPCKPINTLDQSHRSASSRFERPNNTNDTTVVGNSHHLPSLPRQNRPTHPYGGDGNHSIDRRRSSISLHSYSQNDEASDQSFRSAPTTESGSSLYSSRPSS